MKMKQICIGYESKTATMQVYFIFHFPLSGFINM